MYTNTLLVNYNSYNLLKKLSGVFFFTISLKQYEIYSFELHFAAKTCYTTIHVILHEI